MQDDLKEQIQEQKQKTDSRSLCHFLGWILIICGIISTLIKNDYNVFIGFILVICLNRHYFQNKAYYVKIMFQFISLSLIFDIIFIIILYPLWTNHKDKKNEYWNSLKNLHLFGIIMGIGEFLLKILIDILLFNEYKSEKDNTSSLFSFKYPEREQYK